MAELIGGTQTLILTTATVGGLCLVAFVVAAGLIHWQDQIYEAVSDWWNGLG